VELPSEKTLPGALVVRAYDMAKWRYERARAYLILRLVGDRLGPQIVAARVPIEAEVVVPFSEDPARLYQLEQWLPVLEKLAEKHRVLLVVRDIRTLNALHGRTTLPTVCTASFLDLMSLYDLGDFKLGIYVNNGVRNFQSLNNPRMLHVHVNHGESDKLSSFSNQVKGYDRVFVAGPVAVERYREALIEYDDTKLVVVGRPLLDVEFVSTLPASSRRTVLYAPTFEGDSESNNWTSLDRHGESIVEQALALPDIRMIYRPHPRVDSSRQPGVAKAHRSIMRQIESANASDPQAGHVVRKSGSILSMFGVCDALVGDVSSVTLDFLFARPECPIFLTDRRDDRDLLLIDSPLAADTDIIDSSTIRGFGSLLADRLGDDARLEDRARARKHYFGDLQPGESTQRFIAAVSDLIAVRDQDLVGHRRVSIGDVDEHG
jgi:CDP-Glycerol:Poly(glycerophosphate) glycerophosphotransferase